MRIGIDFDNTIACYDDIFNEIAIDMQLLPSHRDRDKQQVKADLLKHPGGMKNWRRLQGQVYGRFINKATIFPGLGSFLLRCSWSNHEIFIVSHKTEYGHFDQYKTPLRQACINWLKNNRFFDSKVFAIPQRNVHFANSRSEKVSKISELNLDYMVDDLIEVFMEPSFPRIGKILFSKKSAGDVENISSWYAIADRLLGPRTDEEIMRFPGCMGVTKEVESVKRIKHGINSEVFCINFKNGKPLALKLYPDPQIDGRQRLKNEKSAFRVFDKNAPVPKPKAFDHEFNAALFEWIDGVDIEIPTDNDIDQLCNFISYLKVATSNYVNSMQLATEACLSLDELITQIEVRIRRLKKVEHPLLKPFFLDFFDPNFRLAKKHSQIFDQKFSNSQYLQQQNFVLSPADFGFHNALRKRDKRVIFLDFEYFGLDDPVKMLADILWHPGMHLDEKQKTKIVSKVLNLLTGDNNTKDRLFALWPLVGLKWALIVLNDFLSQGILVDQSHLSIQLSKAQSILDRLNKTGMYCPYVR